MFKNIPTSMLSRMRPLMYRLPPAMMAGLKRAATPTRTKKIVAGVTCGVSAVGHLYFGAKEEHWYDYRFITDKDPADLADFYGSEAFMDLFCVVPLVGQLMMRGGTFDDEGTVHALGFPGELLVYMAFSDVVDDDDKPLWFNKRERFHDHVGGRTMWDMVQNFGFNTLEDGRVEVYHHGEYFQSSCPPFSLIMRIVFGIHAKWVAWATEHHINNHAFTAETEEEEEIEEMSRTFMPRYLVQHRLIPGLKNLMFGTGTQYECDMDASTEKASFLKLSHEDDSAGEEETGGEEAALRIRAGPLTKMLLEANISKDRITVKENGSVRIDESVADEKLLENFTHNPWELLRMANDADACEMAV